MITIDTKTALEIADDAMDIKGYHVTDCVGYYQIWHDSKDIENDVCIAINKQQEDDGTGKCFAVYVSYPDDDCDWIYTKHLDKAELVELIIDLANSLEKGETE